MPLVRRRFGDIGAFDERGASLCHSAGVRGCAEGTFTGSNRTWVVLARAEVGS